MAAPPPFRRRARRAAAPPAPAAAAQLQAGSRAATRLLQCSRGRRRRPTPRRAPAAGGHAASGLSACRIPARPRVPTPATPIDRAPSSLLSAAPPLARARGGGLDSCPWSQGPVPCCPEPAPVPAFSAPFPSPLTRYPLRPCRHGAACVLCSRPALPLPSPAPAAAPPCSAADLPPGPAMLAESCSQCASFSCPHAIACCRLGAGSLGKACSVTLPRRTARSGADTPHRHQRPSRQPAGLQARPPTPACSVASPPSPLADPAWLPPRPADGRLCPTPV
jgi:hypothetical protein